MKGCETQEEDKENMEEEEGLICEIVPIESTNSLEKEKP